MATDLPLTQAEREKACAARFTVTKIWAQTNFQEGHHGVWREASHVTVHPQTYAIVISISFIHFVFICTVITSSALSLCLALCSGLR